MQKSESERIRRLNLHRESIYRFAGEKFFPDAQIVLKPRVAYPWEAKMIGNYMRINKEFFRCPGRRNNPICDGVSDCGGVRSHSLPTEGGTEFVYPVLIDLLNYVQIKTGRRVVITCAHRCPIHNKYAEPMATHSKHLVGAEVDFYVEGYEQDMAQIVEILVRFYRESEVYATQSEYTSFSVCTGNPRSLAHPGWKNREVAIRVFGPDEGRDFDNRHEHAYISIELLYNREARKKVHYNWNTANQSLLYW